MMKKIHLQIAFTLSLLSTAACGGGGGSTVSTTPPPVPPPTSTNQTPVAMASAVSSIIVEGENIMLSAENSTDADGDALAFTWQQTVGPSVLPGGTISTPNLTLGSPNVEGDTVLTFELTVSDGTSSDTDTVSVTVMPLGFQATDTFFSTIYQSAANNFTAISGGNGIGAFNFSSQEFTSDGTPIGSPVSSSFSPENSDDNVTLNIENIIRSGSVIYTAFTSTFSALAFGAPQEFRLSTQRGPLNQDFLNLGDIYATFPSMGSLLEFDAVAIGDEQLASIALFDVGSGNRDVVSHVVNPDGSAVSSVILVAADLFPVSPVIASFDSTTYAGFWLSSGQIQMQPADVNGNLLGPRVGIAPVSSDFATLVDAVSLPNNQIMLVADELPNPPIITMRVVGVSGELIVNAVEIGNGTEPQAIALNDGNVLVVWDGGNSGFLARIVTPSGGFASETHVLSPERLINPLEPVQLDDGRILIGQEQSLLNFPINALDFFPIINQ